MIFVRMLVCSLAIGFILSPAESLAWKRDPCKDSSAICKTRGGKKVCGYPGESFRDCSSGIDFRKPKNYMSAPERLSPSELKKIEYQKCWEKVMKKQATREANGAHRFNAYRTAITLRKQCGKKP